MSVIKVAAHSRTALVAGAIAGMCREKNSAEVQAIGAGAVNQAVKAVAIANAYLSEEGKSILFVPSFVAVDIEGDIRTAVRLSVEVIPIELEEEVAQDSISIAI
jgi:stage V sporulation protein S